MLLGKVFAKIGSALSCSKKVLNEIFCQKPMLDAVISIRLWVMFVCRVTVLFLKPGENQCSKKENSDWHWRLLDIFFTCVYQSISYPDG